MNGIQLKSNTRETQYEEARIWCDMIDVLINLGLLKGTTKEGIISDGELRIHFYE